MNWETIMCFGDSITIGARSLLAYPEYCGHMLSEQTRKQWNVVNHATSGFTTIDLCRSVTNNFYNLKQFKPEIITLMIGTNDLKCKTSHSDFTIAYQQLLIKLRLIIGNSNIILLEIPELKEGVMLPYKVSMNKMVESYNSIIHELGDRMNFSVKAMTSSEDDFYDGVHLNDNGSKRWGKQLAEMILAERFTMVAAG